ncbi:MAG TPA: sigma-70 family RNA polymerase sigma factor [Alphaproteobacteria bacterium]|nr:sigma-70 family RNA polymerase sigma factor [Alphaproteobacteria bacterium]
MATSFRDDLVTMIPHLRAFARSLTGSADQADDLVQETIMRALRAQDQYQPQTNLKAWLFTILRNQHITTMRRARFNTSSLDDCSEMVVSIPPSQYDKMQMRDVQAALMRLTAEHREVVMLIGAAGVSYEEAAQICGCPIGTVKSRLSRARRELMEMLDEPTPVRAGSQAVEALAA